MKSFLLIALILLAIVAVIIVYLQFNVQPPQGITPIISGAPSSTTLVTPDNHVILTSPPASPLPLVSSQDTNQSDIEIIATNLDIPWEIAFLPAGEILITQRPGQLVLLGQDRSLITITGVRHISEGGLLGLALHPNFPANHYIYLYLTTGASSGLTNRIERYRLEGKSLSERTVIIDGIPGAPNHDGGRIAFGPDQKLYITTGDAGSELNAQSQTSLAGKILRLNDDGTIPADNPFGNAIYSLGHRNAQGLAWDKQGNLWATEHGRSGALSGYDEINLITKGKNYGWPDIQGDEKIPGMENPKIHSGALTTWAPSGAVFVGDDLYFTGLRGQSLYQARISGQSVIEVKAHLKQRFGRLRTIVQGPDGALYLLTNNRDGRGTIQDGDDKIIRIKNPAVLSSQ